MTAPSKTIKTSVLYRSLAFERGTIDEKARTVEMSCSSEVAVERWFGFEILDHAPESVDLARMNSGAALLVNHDGRDQVGVVEEASIKDRQLRTKVRFGKSARAEEIFQDVKDGIRKLVSIGYRIHKMVTDKVEKGVETLRAVNWEPYEVSLVPIPADNSVGVGRAEAAENQFETVVELRSGAPAVAAIPIQNMKRNLLLDPAPALTAPAGGGAAPAAGPDVTAERAAAGKAAFKVAGELFALGRQFNCQAEALTAVNEGQSPESFRKWILENKFSAKPIAVPSGDDLRQLGDIGMSGKEVKRWSLVRAIRMMGDRQNPHLDGLEKEASDAVAKLCGRDASGFFIPNEIVHGTQEQREMVLMATAVRDLAKATGNLGGYTVQTDVLGSSLIELLRNMTVCYELGARKLGGLVGDVAIPSQNGGATAYWVAENAQTTGSNLTFGQVGLSPHRLSAVTALGKMLLAQSSVDVEGLVREDFARVLAIAIDLAGLAGSGAAGQPTGILSTAGIGSVSFGAAATYAKILDFETQVANANALLGSLAYVADPSTRAKLKAAAKIGSTYPTFIWEKGSKPGEGEVNGYKAVATKQIPSSKLLFGNFSDLVIADWIGMDVVVDPYTLADKHQIKVTINMLADVGVRHVGSFCASSDSAAQ